MTFLNRVAHLEEQRTSITINYYADDHNRHIRNALSFKASKCVFKS